MLALSMACGSDTSPTTKTGGAAKTGGAQSGGSVSTGGSTVATTGGAVAPGSGGAATGGSTSKTGGVTTGATGGMMTGTGGVGSGGAGAGGTLPTGGTVLGTGGKGAGGSIGGAGATGGALVATDGSAAGGTTAGTDAGTVVLPAAQAKYFVSPSGSDSNPGTEAEPFLTVTKARDVVRTVNTSMTGDIYVFLRGGNYPITAPITFGVQDSGSKGFRIYYQAYPGETPVLNGAVKVTGWTKDTGNIYKAPLDRKTKLRNLYVNDSRALLTKISAASKGGQGTYAVTTSMGAWAWNAGSGSDGAKYDATKVPAIASNKDDLEIVNGTTWNENIVCTRDVTTASDGSRALLFQQPYGAIAQLPGWNSGFSVSGNHTIYNAREFLNGAGQFFFDKTEGVLYYYPKSGEDMATADVQAPIAEKLIDIAGTSTSNRVKNLTFKGITFANTDYSLYTVAGSRGKASVQGATVFVAYGSGDWHASKYQIIDTFPAMINVNSADGIDFVGNVIKHSGNEGIAMNNDVLNSNVVGNLITDMAGSGITVGHPQHVDIGDGGAHAKYAAGVEGLCTKNSISNNVIYNVSTQPGFGGHAGVTAFYVDSLSITNNFVHTTAYNGIHLGWGWKNFPASTTCKNNAINNNRLFNTLNRLHDSGAIYTIGQMSGTTINQNYVKGIPPATSGPTYGLHNDEGTAFITENDNVLNIDPGVKYTINCEDFGSKHDLTILRTYATVNRMGVNPPNSKIDPPIVVADNVWPLTQYGYCLNSGIKDEYQSMLPAGLVPIADHAFPASAAAPKGTASIGIRSTGNAANTVWFAPSGTNTFTEGATMTKAAGTSTTIPVPSTSGNYKLFVVDGQGKKLGESVMLLRVGS